MKQHKKKPGEFLATKKKNQAREANRLHLKTLKEGESVEMLALDDTGLKRVKVSPWEYKAGDKVLCLFGKGTSRHLRVMKLVRTPDEYEPRFGVTGLSEEFPHNGTIPAKYVFGVVTEVLPLNQTKEDQSSEE